MPHFIDEKCIGCTACVNVCPTDAISGERQALHVIDPDLCIDCSSCARICPVLAISDQNGVYVPRIPKRADWPKPVVIEENCTGCSFCVDICPWDCLALVEGDADGHFMNNIARLVKPDSCVGCKECEEVCAKAAIVVLSKEERDLMFELVTQDVLHAR
jgi:formate hydrogenlyase subunit 6/NADH:ubiquinone oxidoreductase subunit I